jgi:modified peptide precursor CbpA
MVKGSGGRVFVYRGPFFIDAAALTDVPKKEEWNMKTIKKEKVKVVETKKAKADVISHRRSCDAKGTGLSHYILMDKKEK